MSASPSGSSGAADEPVDRVGQAFDLVSYVVATTALFGAVSGVLSVALGGAFLPGVKYGLFVFGWLAFGYGTFLMIPGRPWKADDQQRGASATGDDPWADEGVNVFRRSTDAPDTRFQRAVQKLPPARFRRAVPGNRLPTGVRIFVAGVGMLVVSVVLEQAFGVGP